MQLSRRGSVNGSSSASSRVRVAVRVRPPDYKIPRDESRAPCVAPSSHATNAVNFQHDSHAKSYTYDHVFGPESSQEDIYAGALQPLMCQFLDGFNVTVMAYGQTGSGKTHTMGSKATILKTTPTTSPCRERSSSSLLPMPTIVPPPQSSNTVYRGAPEDGVMPRFLNDLFTNLKKEPSVKTIQVTFVEIYCDTIRDLLNAGSNKALQIREDPHNVWVEDVRLMQVDGLQKALELFNLGRSRQATGANALNDESSRSHAVYTMEVTRKFQSETKKSKLTFVDLAGSERIKKTQVEGVRKRESIQINVGLSALGNVISALADEKANQRRSSMDSSASRPLSPDKHVPYRASKLTRLLRDALGGNSRTLFLACVSPLDSNADETLNTLQYANRARNIQNKAEKNINMNIDHDPPPPQIMVEVSPSQSELDVERLQEEVARLTLHIEQLIASAFAQQEQLALAERVRQEMKIQKKQMKMDQRRDVDVMTEVEIPPRIDMETQVDIAVAQDSSTMTETETVEAPAVGVGVGVAVEVMTDVLERVDAAHQCGVGYSGFMDASVSTEALQSVDQATEMMPTDSYMVHEDATSMTDEPYPERVVAPTMSTVATWTEWATDIEEEEEVKQQVEMVAAITDQVTEAAADATTTVTLQETGSMTDELPSPVAAACVELSTGTDTETKVQMMDVATEWAVDEEEEVVIKTTVDGSGQTQAHEVDRSSTQCEDPLANAATADNELVSCNPIQACKEDASLGSLGLVPDFKVIEPQDDYVLSQDSRNSTSGGVEDASSTAKKLASAALLASHLRPSLLVDDLSTVVVRPSMMMPCNDSPMFDEKEGLGNMATPPECMQIKDPEALEEVEEVAAASDRPTDLYGESENQQLDAVDATEGVKEAEVRPCQFVTGAFMTNEEEEREEEELQQPMATRSSCYDHDNKEPNSKNVAFVGLSDSPETESDEDMAVETTRSHRARLASSGCSCSIHANELETGKDTTQPKATTDFVAVPHSSRRRGNYPHRNSTVAAAAAIRPLRLFSFEDCEPVSEKTACQATSLYHGMRELVQDEFHCHPQPQENEPSSTASTASTSSSFVVDKLIQETHGFLTRHHKRQQRIARLRDQVLSLEQLLQLENRAPISEKQLHAYSEDTQEQFLTTLFNQLVLLVAERLHARLSARLQADQATIGGSSNNNQDDGGPFLTVTQCHACADWFFHDPQNRELFTKTVLPLVTSGWISLAPQELEAEQVWLQL